MRLVTSLGNEATLLSVGDIRFDADEIAWSLAQLNPYGGHSLPYSVAQHCLAVSEVVHPGFAFAGLMHEAHVAYCGCLSDQQSLALDHATFGKWKEYVDNFAVSLRRHFSLPPALPKDVVDSNQLVVEYELGLLFDKHSQKKWGEIGFKTRRNQQHKRCYEAISKRMTVAEAYEAFMRRFREVGNG